jgi:hypothetical protein
MAKSKKKKIPKIRAWGKPSRKVMTMVIPSRKNKLKKRAKRKAKLKKELKKYGL